MSSRDEEKLQNSRRRNLWFLLRRFIHHALWRVKSCSRTQDLFFKSYSFHLKRLQFTPVSVLISQWTVSPPLYLTMTQRTWGRESWWPRWTSRKFGISTTAVSKNYRVSTLDFQLQSKITRSHCTKTLKMKLCTLTSAAWWHQKS